MKNYKNFVIALLTGLLVLSLSTQQAQSAGTSKEAKIIQYDQCITLELQKQSQIFPKSNVFLETALTQCEKYKP
jgi:hypothetical protein